MSGHHGFLMAVQRDRPEGIPTLDENGILHNKQMPPVFQSLEAEADDDILAAQPVYLKSNGHLGLASNTDAMRSRVVGLALNDAEVGHACSYTNFGKVEREDWNEIASHNLFKVGQIYYLDAINGGITNIPPETGYLVEIGRAVSSKAITLNISQSIFL